MKCKYCNSENLILEQRSKDTCHILDAQQVALKCADCGKFIKWCPKTERKFYYLNTNKIYNKLIDQENDHEKLIDDFQQERENLCKQIQMQNNARKRLVQALKNQRYVICEEIRAFFEVNPSTVEWDYLNEILNQIENE